MDLFTAQAPAVTYMSQRISVSSIHKSTVQGEEKTQRDHLAY